MTKIRPVLLWLLLFGSPLGFGQTIDIPNPVSSAHRSRPKLSDADQQPVFTVHRLTGQVEPEKRRPYERSIKGHLVSLPCPTPRQQPQRPC